MFLLCAYCIGDDKRTKVNATFVFSICDHLEEVLSDNVLCHAFDDTPCSQMTEVSV